MIEIRVPTDYWVVFHNQHALVGHREGYAGSNVFFVREDVRKWLNHNVGAGCSRTHDSSEARSFPSHAGLFWRWNFECLDTTELVFEFKNPQHAMMFKLAWVGA